MNKMRIPSRITTSAITRVTSCDTGTASVSRTLLGQRGRAVSSSTSSMISISSYYQRGRICKQQQQYYRSCRGAATTTTTTSAAPVAEDVIVLEESAILSSSSASKQQHLKHSNTSHSPLPVGITINRTMAATITIASMCIGYVIGRMQSVNSEPNHQSSTIHVLPKGLPRTCCDSTHADNNSNTNSYNGIELTKEQIQLMNQLQKIVGKENVLDGRSYNTHTLPFLKGARLGQGYALYIVTPRRLHEVVDCVKAIVNANCTVLPQGQNTGLTGASVPRSNNNNNHHHDSSVQSQHERPIVVLSMKYLDRIFPLDDGKRVVCLAGVGLASLQHFLNQNFPNRESHSTLGSTFLNPTTAAGIAFGSGGTQCRKGPAYTERALYLKVYQNKWEEHVVDVINTLDIEGMNPKKLSDPSRARDPMDSIAYMVDTWSRWIHDGYEHQMRYTRKDCTAKASDTDYGHRLCQTNDNSVSRFNADTRGPDYNRSEGKVVILATVHDTFSRPTATRSFWISMDSLETALAFRKQVCLHNPEDLPISVEYMDRDAFDVVDKAGRVLALMIQALGTSSSMMRQFWNVKLWIESLPFSQAPFLADKILYWLNPVAPTVLPRDVWKAGTEWDHHIVMSVGEYGTGNMERLLERMDQFEKENGSKKIHIRECSKPNEISSLNAFRFVAASAFRTYCVGNNLQGISVDYALPKNGGALPPLVPSSPSASIRPDSSTWSTWFASSTKESKTVPSFSVPTESTIIPIQPMKRMRYSHFACNVVHEDLAYDIGVNVEQAKHELKEAVEFVCCGRLPAEHGHGTEYHAPPDTQARWQQMDPLNVMNPGVGGLSKNYKYI